MTSFTVLFVRVHNTVRSQMAAAILDHYAQGHVRVCSGRSEPANRLNPVVVESMAEIGLDITSAYPKPTTDEMVRDADVVVTMGCGDACPIAHTQAGIDCGPHKSVCSPGDVLD